LFPFHMLGMRSLAWIDEWQATDFSKPQVLEFMILGSLALGFTGKLWLQPIRSLMLLGLIHAALSHTRNEQLLGLIGVLILAEPIGRSLGRGGAAEPGPRWRRLALSAPLLVLLAFGLRIALPPGPDRSGAAFAATLRHVPQALQARPVLNEYGYGAQLIFQG